MSDIPEPTPGDLAREAAFDYRGDAIKGAPSVYAHLACWIRRAVAAEARANRAEAEVARLNVENEAAVDQMVSLEAERDQLRTMVGTLAKTLRDVKAWHELNKREGSILYKPVCAALAKLTPREANLLQSIEIRENRVEATMVDGRIAELESDVSAERKFRLAAQAERDQLRTLNAELAALLKPFTLLDDFGNSRDDDTVLGSCCLMNTDPQPTVGDVRRAAAALAKLTPDKEPNRG